MSQITQLKDVDLIPSQNFIGLTEFKGKHKYERMGKFLLFDGQPRGMVHESYYSYKKKEPK